MTKIIEYYQCIQSLCGIELSMAAAVVLILFFGLITYLLLVPLVLVVNSSTNEYYIQLKGLVKAGIIEDAENLLKIRLQVFF